MSLHLPPPSLSVCVPLCVCSFFGIADPRTLSFWGPRTLSFWGPRTLSFWSTPRSMRHVHSRHIGTRKTHELSPFSTHTHTRTHTHIHTPTRTHTAGDRGRDDADRQGPNFGAQGKGLVLGRGGAGTPIPKSSWLCTANKYARARARAHTHTQ